MPQYLEEPGHFLLGIFFLNLLDFWDSTHFIQHPYVFKMHSSLVSHNIAEKINFVTKCNCVARPIVCVGASLGRKLLYSPAMQEAKC
jgi:hypothetical protein